MSSGFYFSCLVLLPLIANCLVVPDDEELINEWQNYKAVFYKKYNPQEDERRFQIYRMNKNKISIHNELYDKGLVSYSMKMNQFGDLLHDEFLVMLVTGNPNTSEVYQIDDIDMIIRWKNPNETLMHMFVPDKNASIPESIDWNAKGAVTEVQDQGRCGSCWAFSAIGSLEAQNFLKTGKLVQLSAQNLVDCAYKKHKYFSFACDGGDMSEAFRYVQENGGICSKSSYPYKGQRQECSHNVTNVAAQCRGYIKIQPKDEQQLKEAVATLGPISTSIDARGEGMQFYHKGIYQDEKCSRYHTNHAVLITGYGVETQGVNNGTKYWLVKNSWGKTWGDLGYIKMLRDSDNYCAIATYMTCPQV